MKHKILLGVNIDHAATLKQVRNRSTNYPDLLQIALLAKKGGAEQITIHLREDRRHIHDSDVVQLCKKSPLPINLEMAVNKKILKIALKNKPKWVCFVPEKRAELTTEGGLNIENCFAEIKKMIIQLNKKNILVSCFIEPSLEQVEFAARVGCNAIEIHTGKWVLAKAAKKNAIWKDLVAASDLAHWLGMRVHAGHGLDYKHAKLIKKLPYLQEVNIGHSLICYALEDGLQRSVKKMKNELA
ncbi:MAG: pyridoxine 5'-phosphate synthase [Pseudobdellovibrio sp.]